MTAVHVVLPVGVDDPERPSGGNTYDRMLCRGLAVLGWDVREDAVPAPGPRGARPPAAALAEALARVPSGSLVLLDGLVASDRPDALCAEAGRLRMVVLVHLPLGLGGPDGKGHDVRVREAAALRCVAAVVTTSRWTRHWLLDAYGLEPSEVAVAEPGVEPAPLTVEGAAGLGLLCVGAVVAAKGHDVLVEALARVPEPGWRCLCVGATDRNPAFADRLWQRVVSHGLADRVRFTGPLGGSALAGAHARTDLFVTASRGETYGMAVTEALAHGIPVLATRVGGLPEAVGHAPGGRRPGILVPPDDPGALAGALEHWFGDPGLRAHLREAAAARRRSLPGWTVTSAAVSRVLTEAAA